MPADLARDGATGVCPANRYLGSNVGTAVREVPQGIAEADIPGIRAGEAGQEDMSEVRRVPLVRT